MSLAADQGNAGQSVVTGITVNMHIAFEPFQEALGVLARPGGLIIVKNNRRLFPAGAVKLRMLNVFTTVMKSSGSNINATIKVIQN